MNFQNIFKSDIFFIFYRFIFPIILVILFFVIPWLNSTIYSYQPFDIIFLLFIITMMAGAYSSVTFLNEVPSKRAARLRYWVRFGTFKENKFIPYFDRHSFGYIYYLNAIGASAITSIVLGYMLIINDVFPAGICTTIGMINFFLLFIPFAFQYRVFESALYSSD